MGRLGVLLLRWFGGAQEHAAFKFQLAPLKFAGAARRQGGFSADGFNNPKLQLESQNDFEPVRRKIESRDS